jgi:hypothetical protein
MAPKPDEAFFTLELRDGSGQVVHRNTFFPVPYKRCELAAAKVSAEVVGNEGSRYTIRLATDAPAFFVWADLPGIRGTFSDNSITLLPGEPRNIVFVAKDKTDIRAVKKALRVTHLRDTY